MLLFGIKPVTKREILPFVRSHFPLSTIVDLPGFPEPHELAAAFDSSIPKFCFAEAAGREDPVLDLIPQLLRHDPRLGIVAIVPAEDPDLVLRCLRQGATEFLVPPFKAEHVGAVVQKLLKLLPQVDSQHVPGKVYCVMPVKGACGGTTVGCNMAYALKRQTSKRVLLADLDPLTGVIGFLLKVQSQVNVLDALRRSSELDADLWRGMVTDRHGVDVLLAPELLGESASELVDATPILDFVRLSYDLVIADAGGAFGEWNLSQAQFSDEVILVTTNDLPALYSCQKVLKYLESNGVGRWKLKVVVNQYDPDNGLREDMIADALHTHIDHLFPVDHSAVRKAQMHGEPVSASSNFGRSLALFAEKLTGKTAPAKKASSFAGLRSLFSRSSS